MEKESIYCFLDERFENKYAIVGGYFICKEKMGILYKNLIDIKMSYGFKEKTNIKWSEIGRKRVDFSKKLLGLFSDPSLDIKSMVAMVWIGNRKNSFSGWKQCLNDFLERLGINLDQMGLSDQKYAYPNVYVFFDNLPKGRNLSEKQLAEFLKVYNDIYLKGATFDDRNTIPPLKDFKAFDSMLIAPSRSCVEVQLADFFVGICGDFLSWVYENKHERIVREIFPIIYPSFVRKVNDNDVFGCGLKVDKNSRDKIECKLSELGLSRY